MLRRGLGPLLGAAVVLLAVYAVVEAPPDDAGLPAAVADVVVASLFAVSGGFLALRRPHHPLGWLFLTIGLCDAVADSATTLAVTSASGGVQTWSAWVASWVWFPALSLFPTVVLALYPSGRAGSRARRMLVAAASLGTAFLVLALSLVPDSIEDIVPGATNPLAVPALGTALAVAGGVLLVPAVLLTLVDAGRRLWRARSPEREQLGWLLAMTVIACATSGTSFLLLRSLVFGLIPVAVVVGVLRYRLLDLQVIVRRTLLFAALTVVVVAVFVLATAALSPLVEGDGLPIAVSAGLVAALLNPVRERLQRGVDRLVYGARRDPVRALAGVGREVARSDDDALLGQVLALVAEALRSPQVQVVPTGVEAEPGVLHRDLQVRGRSVGVLLVAPRVPDEGWSREDLRLLDLLVPQVAVVAHAERLNAELAASRDRVVTATGQERQRLRQELHDGLGPALSGIALGLEAAEVSLTRDPVRTAALLARLRAETQGAGREVRRLVEGMRPTALDGQDLTAALRDFVAGLDASVGGRLRLSLDVAPDLPKTSAELDAAVYRIAAEALTNVVRHSGASACTLRLAPADGELLLTVEDDGTGLPAQPRDGVGLVSMRRRAAELGGRWDAGARIGGGTRVQVALPLTAEVPA